jgi:hypothetical protein
VTLPTVQSYRNRAEAVAHANANARRYLGVWRVFDIADGNYRVVGAWCEPRPNWRLIHRAEPRMPIDAQEAPF